MDVRLLIATWPDEAPHGAVVRFCREHKIARSTFYEIRARVARVPLEQVLIPTSTRPSRSPLATPLEVEDLAVRLRKQLGDDGWDCGPKSVRHEMLRLGVAAPSIATLSRIFSSRGLVIPQPQKRPRSSWKRFTFPAPNSCWQLDGMDWTLAGGTVVCVLQVIDDHSRRLLASLVATGETSEAALEVIHLALQRFGVPQHVLTDNGAAFNPTRQGKRGQLETFLRSLGVRPIASTPNHPQTCGKDERVHKTLQRYLDARPRAADIAELQAHIDRFDQHYNHVRPHQSLSMRTPVEAWNATPVAPPPNPAEPDTPRRPNIKVTQPKTDKRGKTWVADRSIHLGAEYIGTRVLALRDGDHVDLFTADGTHIRSVDFTPDRNHYGSGRDRLTTIAMKRSAHKN